MKSDKSNLGIKLGENIAERRKELGLTQAELAEKLGTDAVTVSRFERGSNLPSLLRCEQLAEVLNISLGKLLSESSWLIADQDIHFQNLLESLDKNDRIFLMDMVKNWAQHLNTNK